MNIISRTLKFTLGLIVGAGVGAAATMLLAPTSGKLNRQQLKARIDAALKAGQDAQHDRERELQKYWEQQIEDSGEDKKLETKKK